MAGRCHGKMGLSQAIRGNPMAKQLGAKDLKKKSKSSLDGRELDAMDKGRVFESACLALQAWLELPLHRRKGSGTEAADVLLEAAFGLLSAPSDREELAYYGLEKSMRFDDAEAMAVFGARGARVKPVEPLEADSNDGYFNTWEQSLGHFCAGRGSLNCLRYLLDTGSLGRDAAVAAPLLKEPSGSVLRGIDKKDLERADRAALTRAGGDPDEPLGRAAMESMRDLVWGLLSASAQQSEDIGLSIAIAELSRSNPLFMILRKEQSEGAFYEQAKQGSEAFTALCQDLGSAGLFDPSKASHRAALLSLCSKGSEPACALGAKAGLGPSCAGPRAESEFLRSIARSGKFPPWAGVAIEFMRSWSQEPGFSDKLLSHALKEARSLVGIATGDQAPSRKSSAQWEQESRDAVGALNALARCAKGIKDLAAPWEPPSAELLAEASMALDAMLLDAFLIGTPLRAAAKLAADDFAELAPKPSSPGPRL